MRFSVILFVTILSNCASNLLLIETIIALKQVLDYLSLNYEKINVDCLFGVVFSNVFLHDLIEDNCSVFNEKQLFDQTVELYKKSWLLLQNATNWYFAKFMVNPEIWYKTIKLKKNLLNPVKNPSFLSENPEYSEFLSDFCLANIINETKTPGLKHCKIQRQCLKMFHKKGSGYVLTHKLLLLQTAKARNCIIPPEIYMKSTKILCSQIYSELITTDKYHYLKDTFDLFLEQSILCGYEGFFEFLTEKWLKFILDNQEKSGCFPNIARKKRDINIWDNGCADHTTGLGTAVLALYLNYLAKIQCDVTADNSTM